MDGHTVEYSKTAITELMIPSYANFGGKIHGGILLSLMDKAAYACATRHAGTYCVTVSVDTVHFLQPVDVGDLVSLLASVNYVGNTSLVVGIKVIAENVQTRTVKHTNTSYFTMVAKNADGRTQQVPPLILETEDDVRRFAAARERRRLTDESRRTMDRFNQAFVPGPDQVAGLADQRCEVRLGPDSGPR
jgi:uncharacterized protein (TIGR00369 family)